MLPLVPTNLLSIRDLSPEMLNKLAAAKLDGRSSQWIVKQAIFANLSRILLPNPPARPERPPSKNTAFYNAVAFWPLFARTIKQGTRDST
jgi:hypothetical protein